jgi:4-hydroxy 2-oxovalerate aldolase
MKHILISDPTLRDGSHAVQHRLTLEQISSYTAAAEAAGIPIVEVGHGNGLGASSLQVGESLYSDLEMLQTARANLKKSKLGIHVIPGFATIKKDLSPIIDIVDVIRVAAHCTEADITARHIDYAKNTGKDVYGVLMMSHMAPSDVLVEECMKMESYGADGVIIMDSAGAYIPSDVSERIGAIVNRINIPVGFHAHNNLGLSIANSIAAIEAGALILDGTIKGFGAGAGNAQLEVLVAVLHKMGYTTGIDLYGILDAADIAERELVKSSPTIKSLSIVSGLSGVFSAFSVHVDRVSKEFGVNPRDVFFELGKRKIVAGQEDMIVEVAIELSKGKQIK